MTKTTPNESSRQNDSAPWVDNRWSRQPWILPGTLALIPIAVISAIGPLNMVTSVVISLSEDSEYSAGYSESAFQNVEVGAGEDAVRSVLGAPLNESAAKPYMRWLYTPTTEPVREFEENGGCPDIRSSFTTVDFGEDGDTPLSSTHLLNQVPEKPRLGPPDSRLLVPGDPRRSELMLRISASGAGRKPNLATSVVDQWAVAVMREWIRGLAAP